MKTKCLTDAVFEISSPAKVDKLGTIDVDDKFRRIDRHLRTVIDFWIVYFSASTRCMLETGTSEESIKFTGSDTFLTFEMYTDGMFEDISDAFSFARCCKDSHRPRTISKFTLEIGQIPFVKHI